MADVNQPSGNHWTIDRRIPLAVVATIFGQTVALIVWGTTLTNRVAALEEVARQDAPRRDQFIELRVEFRQVQENIAEIKRLIQTRPPAPTVQ
jgi:hypothetical protein